MKDILNNWKPLNDLPENGLYYASNTLHHAAQYVAIAGKYLLPENNDDSHTTATWNSFNNWLCGQIIRCPDHYLRITLDYIHFEILIIDEKDNILVKKQLNGRTKSDIYAWLKNQLQNLGMDAELISGNMHYEIPEHPVEEGEPFSMPDPVLLQELAKTRTNGHLLNQHFADQFKTAHPVLIWPHHFDEGCYVPLRLNSNEVSGSISFGLAMPDIYYRTPYFYVTAWKKEGINDDRLPVVNPPGKWHKHEWTGQVLTISDLVKQTDKNQAQLAIDFMGQAIQHASAMVNQD